MRSVPSALSSRKLRLLAQLSCVALAGGLSSACTSGVFDLKEPVFTGSTANQQQILTGQATAYNSAPASSGSYSPAPTYSTASSSGIQRQQLSAPGSSGGYAGSSYAAQAYAPTTPTYNSAPAYQQASAPAYQPTASQAPQPYTPPRTIGETPNHGAPTNLAAAPAYTPSLPQVRGTPPTTLGAQASQIGGQQQPAPTQVASLDPQSMATTMPGSMVSAAPAPMQVPAPVAQQQPTAETAAIGVQPQAAARAAEAANNPPAAGPEAAPGNFRWPVRGRIISGFGKKPNGERNDGINLAVPEGTAVKAAEDGTVIYAGNELKSYGNLVLIRHENGWVSAYAHNKDLQVKRGDQVRRGQIVANSGMSGGVTTPQVHFELRKDATPVDPVSHLSDA